jgi:hypothetical protein
VCPTKGQHSRVEPGKITKSIPDGSADLPFNSLLVDSLTRPPRTSVHLTRVSRSSPKLGPPQLMPQRHIGHARGTGPLPAPPGPRNVRKVPAGQVAGQKVRGGGCACKVVVLIAETRLTVYERPSHSSSPSPGGAPPPSTGSGPNTGSGQSPPRRQLRLASNYL